MDYNFSQDLKAIREILGVSQQELADTLGVQQITISRNEQHKTSASADLLEKVYSYAYSQKININRLKDMLCKEDLIKGHRLLYHGAKRPITGDIDINCGRSNNDFGKGFYTGENYDQAASFVTGFVRSSVYLIDFDKKGLKCKTYKVDSDWMMTIAYYRGTLERYRQNPYIKKLVKESRSSDYIIAPIADNRMFQIIDSYIAGEITDEQCKHCLAATNLGNQYIFISDRSVKNLKILDHCYLSEEEREHYKNVRISDSKLGEDKVKLARIKYRGRGKYIDELLGSWEK